MRITVAICDDLEEERLQMARLLKNYGRRKGVAWEIELLESGAAFLDLFRPGRWDIILMDIYMDGPDGMEAARRLRAQDSECALLFVTTSVEHGIASYELQASDYLVKPVAQRDLGRGAGLVPTGKAGIFPYDQRALGMGRNRNFAAGYFIHRDQAAHRVYPHRRARSPAPARHERVGGGDRKRKLSALPQELSGQPATHLAHGKTRFCDG